MVNGVKMSLDDYLWPISESILYSLFAMYNAMI